MEPLKKLLLALKKHYRFFFSFIAGYVLTSIIRRKLMNVKPIENSVVLHRSSFYDFLEKVEAKDVAEVLLHPNSITFKSGEKMFYTNPASNHPAIADKLFQKKIPFDEIFAGSSVSFRSIMLMAFPFVYLGCIIYVFKNYLGPDAGSKTLFFGKKKKDKQKTSFDDIAGISQAKEQVRELMKFYKNPDAYTKFGARIPKGVLLVGPPGTGKTLLAKALASECDMPFFYCSGSDFVEVYSGRGASRVRSLFSKAKKAAPSIVFIDEIDAIGKKRSNDLNMAMNDEREQTLNQLLFCMDGFADSSSFKETVIVIAATNRYEALDGALIRPGRFDRIVRVGLPDRGGREEMYKVHSKKLRMGKVDFPLLSDLSPGFSGAEIASVCNEAAIIAIRYQSNMVDMSHFHEALQSFKTSRGRQRSKQARTENPGDILSQLFPYGNFQRRP